MAKFAQYYIQFIRESGAFDWEERQDHLGQLLANDDSIEFGEGKYKHKVYHLTANPNIIVMRFANDKDVLTEKDFQEKIINFNKLSLFFLSFLTNHEKKRIFL